MAEDYISLIGEDGLKELDLAKKSAKELADIVVDTNSKIADMYGKLKSNKSFAEFNKQLNATGDVLAGLRNYMAAYETAAAEAARAGKQMAAAADAYARAQAAQASSAAAGVKDLKQTMQDMAKELPAMSGGILSFFRAVSDKIPALVEQIVKARKANQALIASGETAIPVWKQLATGVFSWQTALVAGVSILASYAGKLSDVGDEAKDAKADIDALTDSFDRQVRKLNEMRNVRANKAGIGADALEKDIELLKAQGASADKILAKKKEYNNAMARELENEAAAYEMVKDEASKLYQFYYNLKDPIEVIRKKMVPGLAQTIHEAIDVSMEDAEKMAKEMAATYNTSLSFVKRFSEESTRLNVKASLVRKQNEIDEAEYKKNQSRAGKGIPIHAKPATGGTNTADTQGDALAAQERLNKALADLRKENIEKDMKAQQEIFDNEKAMLSERLAAHSQYINDKLALLKTDYQAEIAGTQAQLNQIAAIEQKAATARNDAEKKLLSDKEALEAEKAAIVAKYQLKQNDILAEAGAASLNIMRGSYSEQDKEIETQLAGQLNIIEANKNTLIAAEHDKYAKGEISEKQYRQRVADIQKQALEAAAKKEIEYTQKLIALKRARGEDVGALEIVLSEFELQLQESTDAKKIEAARRTSDELKKLPGMFITAVNQSYQNQTTAIDDEIAKLNEAKQAELDWIEQSTLSREEKDKKIAALNIKTENEEKRLANEKKRIAKEQAGFNKAMSAAQVVINTALAIMKNTAELGFVPAIPVNIITGILGAAQLGIILGTKIPEYADGTPDGGHPYDGLAMVGDGGEREIVIGRKGAWITPDAPTKVWLNKGDTVIPMHDLVAASGGQLSAGQAGMIVNMAGDNKRMEQLLEQLLIVQQNQPVVERYKDARGWLHTTVTQGNHHKEYIKKRVYD